MRIHLLVASLLLAVPAGGQEQKASRKISATWWGHSAWILKTPGGATIAVDPWLKNPKAPKDVPWPEQVDAILVTHGHFDHVGEAAELAKRTGATVIGAFELVKLIGAEHGNGGNMGGTIAVKDARIHIVAAVHSSGFGTDPAQPPLYGGNPVGFVIEIEGGTALYHAGDTDAFGDMALIAQRYHPTVALLPIGGQFTMDPQGAALAARMLKVPAVVPMHYGTFPVLTGTPEQLIKAVGSGATKVIVFKPGETKQL